MIFKPRLARLILDGTKTQTRRPPKPGVTVCRYIAGRDYAVQDRRGGRSLARIYITDVRGQSLGQITLHQAHAEGFPDRVSFLDYWHELYGSVDLQQFVWAITFKLEEATDAV